MNFSTSILYILYLGQISIVIYQLFFTLSFCMIKPADKISGRPPSANKHPHRQDRYIREPIRTVDGQIRVKTYQKLKAVGQGAYSKCFLAKNIESDSTYVVKVIPKKKLQVLAKQKLVYEIKIHQSLTHPNIVYFDHWFEDQKYKYIFMEYCANGNLQERLQSSKTLPQSAIKKYVRQIVEAIGYIHSQKVLHRDLKLCNFYLDDKDNIKLGDFGFACQLANELDRKRETCGTPNYIAPQAISGFGYSFSSDVWAIGVILFRLKYGECPFEGETVKATLMNVKICNFTFPSYPKISPQLKNLIESIFNLNYDERLTTDQILAHKFFDEQDQKTESKKPIEKRGFSLKNIFSRERTKQVSPPRHGMMERETRNSEQSRKKQQPKRTNSCQTLKEMKEIFKSKSKQNISYNSSINTKSEYNSFASMNTQGRGQTTRTNIIDTSINMNMNLLNSMNTKKEDSSRVSRLNQFVKTQMNSISLKEQLKKGIAASKNGTYLIQDDKIMEEKIHKQKLSINDTVKKQNQINCEMLYSYSKRYHLPIEIQHEKNIIILHYPDPNFKQVIYDKTSYIIYKKLSNIFTINGLRIEFRDLSKILQHILQNKIKIQIQETASSSKMQSAEDNQFAEFIENANFYEGNRNAEEEGEAMQKILLKVPHFWVLAKDGILLKYGSSGKVIVCKQMSQECFYIQDEDKPKKKLMYTFKKDQFEVADGVVWQNYYSAWVSACLKYK